jgi:hypothetical protein
MTPLAASAVEHDLDCFLVVECPFEEVVTFQMLPRDHKDEPSHSVLPQDPLTVLILYKPRVVDQTSINRALLSSCSCWALTGLLAQAGKTCSTASNWPSTSSATRRRAARSSSSLKVSAPLQLHREPAHARAYQRPLSQRPLRPSRARSALSYTLTMPP